MTAIVRCPKCGTAVEWTAASRWRPFCSPRCKSVDLGEWAANRYVLAGGPAGAGDDPSAAGDTEQATRR